MDVIDSNFLGAPLLGPDVTANSKPPESLYQPSLYFVCTGIHRQKL